MTTLGIYQLSYASVRSIRRPPAFCILSSCASQHFYRINHNVSNLSSRSCPIHRRPAPRKPDALSPCTSTPKHRRISQHVGHDKEPHVATADVDLIKMGDAAIAGGDSDILELNVHVVFRFQELAPIHLPGSEFQSDDVALESERRCG